MPENGLVVPDTELSHAAWEFVRRIETPVLANHSIRAYFFGRAQGERAGLRPGVDYDDELLFLGAVLHDVGLTEEGNGSERFEVDGADLAVRFLLERGIDQERADVVWDAIALHTIPGIPNRKRPEIALMQSGTYLDVAGLGTGALPPGYAEAVHAAYPRLGIEAALSQAVVDQALAKPSKAAPGTFAAELAGQRVPEAKAPGWDEMLERSEWRGIA
ncbi:HD domain-containing protein [Amycolatopsis anabasis]|uniref:HD domain-containing protein n=1 Tax=Amycolatopsis anabasis TaxID=1840409 RepID=UPI00131DA22B|nr:HD domain-containing protein [Amycolatopsis anabasis]